MKPHPPFTRAEWDTLAVAPPFSVSCPDCGSANWYGARGPRPDGAGGELRYRMCKMCGFWQEADGQSQPVRCWQSQHLCRVTLGPGKQRTCDQHQQPRSFGPGPGTFEHECEKFLLSDEDGYQCQTCGEWQGRATTVAWACQGSD